MVLISRVSRKKPESYVCKLSEKALSVRGWEKGGGSRGCVVFAGATMGVWCDSVIGLVASKCVRRSLLVLCKNGIGSLEGSSKSAGQKILQSHPASTNFVFEV